MKIFLDTANLDAIKRCSATGLVDGVTTNPSHLSKEGGDPKKLITAISALVPEVSVEVTEKDPEAVYKQAKAIAALGKNIVVKIPCHKDYVAVISRLSHEGVKVNVTLIFTAVQALAMCKLGAYIVSPFVGRLDDIDEDGAALLYDIRHMITTYHFKTLLLAASLRNLQHVHEAIMAGVDIATVPVELFDKLLEHPLTETGIKKFDDDWKKLGIRQFP